MLLGILLRVVRSSASLEQNKTLSGILDQSRDHNTSLSVEFSVGAGLCRRAAAAKEETEIRFQVAEMRSQSFVPAGALLVLLQEVDMM